MRRLKRAPHCHVTQYSLIPSTLLPTTRWESYSKQLGSSTQTNCVECGNQPAAPSRLKRSPTARKDAINRAKITPPPTRTGQQPRKKNSERLPMRRKLLLLKQIRATIAAGVYHCTMKPEPTARRNQEQPLPATPSKITPAIIIRGGYICLRIHPGVPRYIPGYQT